MIEITLTTLVASGAFVAAEQFHYSGVIATVRAGFFCDNQAHRDMSPSSRIAIESFWEYVTFAFNSIVFRGGSALDYDSWCDNVTVSAPVRVYPWTGTARSRRIGARQTVGVQRGVARLLELETQSGNER